MTSVMFHLFTSVYCIGSSLLCCLPSSLVLLSPAELVIKPLAGSCGLFGSDIIVAMFVPS